MNLRKTTEYSTVLLTALSAGVLFGTKVSLGPSMKGFTPRTYVEQQQATVRNLRPVMGTLLPASTLANLALLVVSPRRVRSREFTFNALGSAAQIPSLVLTAVFELPADTRVLSWSADDPPADWESVRDRWDRIHTLRTATSVAGLALVTAAAQQR